MSLAEIVERMKAQIKQDTAQDIIFSVKLGRSRLTAEALIQTELIIAIKRYAGLHGPLQPARTPEDRFRMQMEGYWVELNEGDSTG